MAMDWAAMERDLIAEIRTGDGSVTSGPFAGRPVLLLTTVGAKSGEPRTTPLVYTVDDGRMVIIASKNGAPTHPAWYLNLVKEPTASVEAGGERFRVQASVVSDTAERRRLYDQHAATHPSFTEYEARAGDRVIPVIVLERLP